MDTYSLLYVIRGAKPFAPDIPANFTPINTPTTFALRIGFPITRNIDFEPQRQAILQYDILRNNNRKLFEDFEEMQGAITDPIITKVLQDKGWLPVDLPSVVYPHFKVSSDEFIELLKTFVAAMKPN